MGLQEALSFLALPDMAAMNDSRLSNAGMDATRVALFSAYSLCVLTTVTSIHHLRLPHPIGNQLAVPLSQAELTEVQKKKDEKKIWSILLYACYC